MSPNLSPRLPRNEVGEAPVILQQLVPFVGERLEEVQVQPDRVRRHLRARARRDGQGNNHGAQRDTATPKKKETKTKTKTKTRHRTGIWVPVNGERRVCSKTGTRASEQHTSRRQPQVMCPKARYRGDMDPWTAPSALLANSTTSATNSACIREGTGKKTRPTHHERAQMSQLRPSTDRSMRISSSAYISRTKNQASTVVPSPSSPSRCRP